MTKDTVFSRDSVVVHNEDASILYQHWPTPDVIVSDGGYGVGGFPGDPPEPHGLAKWYEAHIKAWSSAARAGTTLWFWNTEIGWATVHPLLDANGWDYVCCNVWNKGIGHIAGNCNLPVLKGFPVVTEVCVQYVRRPEFIVDRHIATLKMWLRAEWGRTGIPLAAANAASGVANAATRKYLTKDHLWYAPLPDIFAKLSAYANKHGHREGRPYFSLDGKAPMSEMQYAHLFPTFRGKYGITNVWSHPPLHNGERIRVHGSTKYAHLNQKPLSLTSLIIDVSSGVGDVIWEPFGGLCTATLASLHLSRRAYAAEIDPLVYKTAISRFTDATVPLFQLEPLIYNPLRENADTDAYTAR